MQPVKDSYHSVVTLWIESQIVPIFFTILMIILTHWLTG